MNNNSVIRLGGILLLAAGALRSEQPLPPRISLTSNYDNPGTVLLQVRNDEQCRVDLTLDPGSLSTITFPSQALTVEGNSLAFVTLSGLAIGPGRQVLHVQAQPKSICTSTTPAVLYEPLLASKGGIARITYDQAFLSRRVAVPGTSESAMVDYGQKYAETAPISRLVFRPAPLPAGTVVLDEHPLDLKKLLSLKPGTLPSVSNPQVTGKAVKDGSERMIVRSLSGRLALRTGVDEFRNAWGFTVKVWQDAGFWGGGWRMLGASQISFAGFWTVNLDSTRIIEGLPFHVEYLSQNRFVRLQDPDGNPYAWAQDASATATTVDLGEWFVDLTTRGDIPKLNNLLYGSNYLWDKFVSIGVSPLRDDPIRITYPNTLATGNCVNDDNPRNRFAWSCSYAADGRIYLIADHAATVSTVQHEIAHSIHAFYWHGGRPAGSGGSHSLNNCFNPGLALTEGFADFTAFWVQFYPDAITPVAPGLNYNIDMLPGGTCPGPSNESQVSATFWDLYDIPNDFGLDSVVYPGNRIPIAVFLGSPRNSMADYLPLLITTDPLTPAANLASVFRLNTIAP